MTARSEQQADTSVGSESAPAPVVPKRSSGRARPRRDSDPVRVYGDRRIAYWDGGRVGVGTRRMRRFPTAREANDAAASLRTQFARTAHHGPLERAPLINLMQAMLRHHQAVAIPVGSLKQYRSNWNRWVPIEVRLTPCDELTLAHWTQIFDGLTAEHASAATIRAVARTMGSILQFGLGRGYFVDQEPFALAAIRRETVRNALRDAARYAVVPATAGTESVLLEECPTWPDVDRYAAAFELCYPRYGRRLVEAAYASGLRIGELLGAVGDDVDLDRGLIDVSWQLDRYGSWPDLARPKGGPRTAMYWHAFDPVFTSLVEEAQARSGPTAGWLFPPPQGVRSWLSNAGRRAATAADASRWPWTFHWLRHAWASASMAPAAAGGFGLDPASVSRWLGHKRLSTTLNMYVVRQTNDHETARRLTKRLPGANGHSGARQPADRTSGGPA
jgi:integrase